MRKLCTLFAFIGLSFSCLANYVQVIRSANIYSESNSSSYKMLKAEVGDMYELVSTTQFNGYFNVKIPNTKQTGWIYRTLVRHHEGSLPGKEHQIASNDQVVVHVIDVGAGLCTVIEMPDDRYVIFDAGHYRGSGRSTYRQILEVIPEGAEIDYMILSHTDADHIGAASYIIQNHYVRKLLWTGFEKSMITSSEPTATYRRMMTAIDQTPFNMKNINLNARDSMVVPGTKIKYGETTLTLICGFGKPLDSWGKLSDSEQLNAVSIVAKVEYRGSSVLITGDAVGRHIDDPAGTMIATEHYMVTGCGAYLDSDVILAPHHGADNGSSEAFIQAVSPEVVIFPAGNDHDHPRESAVRRYLQTVDINNIFRTDRGDDESGHNSQSKEWKHESIEGCTDSYDDDDIDIILKADGTYSVYYVEPNKACD